MTYLRTIIVLLTFVMVTVSGAIVDTTKRNYATDTSDLTRGLNWYKHYNKRGYYQHDGTEGLHNSQKGQ